MSRTRHIHGVNIFKAQIQQIQLQNYQLRLILLNLQAIYLRNNDTTKTVPLSFHLT